MSYPVIVHIVVKAKSTGDLVYCVDTIKRPDEGIKYSIPRDKQPEKFHPGLFALPALMNAKKNMVKIGHYRNLRVSLKGDLIKMYLDEDGNFVFLDFYLEECSDAPSKPKASANDSTAIETQSSGDGKDYELKHVEKKFLIEKFNGKQNASEWLDSFKAECARYNIEEEVQKVKCLKLFLQDRAKDWYDANVIKISKEDWSLWEISFLKVFSAKSWTQVRYAYGFRHLTGSLVEYALKKEKLILEVESKMTATSRINLIVLGLPAYIQDKLDREELEDTDDLINRLGQYEITSKGTSVVKKNAVEAKNDVPVSWKSKSNFEKSIERKPCSVCESLGYHNRYHPVEKCRNRDRQGNKMKVNLNDATEMGLSQAEFEYEHDRKN